LRFSLRVVPYYTPLLIARAVSGKRKMTEEINTSRPQWLKVLLGIFCAWIAFILILIVLLTALWIIQVKLLDIEIEGTPAAIILIVQAGIGGLVAYRTAKWQNKFLDNKPLSTSYIVLTLLILLSVLTIPAPMTYTMF